MDKPGIAGRDSQERTSAPQGRGCGGSTVGNGVCHGHPHPCVPDSDPVPLVKTGEDAEGEGGGGLWASPNVRVETCGALMEDWQGKEVQEEEDKDLPAREVQEEREAEPSLKELLDVLPPTPSGSKSSSTLGPEEDKETGVWQPAWEGEMLGDLEPPFLCPEDQEEKGGSGLEDDGKDKNRNEGHDRLGEMDRDGEEEEEGGDEDQEGRSEEGKDSRLGGEPGLRRLFGGKRGRGRLGEQAVFASSKTPLFAGGRHKQTRRRNHHHQGRFRGTVGSRVAVACRELLAESVRPWCLSCLRMVVELIVLVAHRCGEAVEASGTVLYDSGSLLLHRATDLPVLKAETRRLLGRVTTQGADLWDRAAGSARRGWRVVASCLRLLGVVVLLGATWARGMLGRVSGERGQRWWASFQDSRAWKGVVAVWEKVSTVFWRGGQQASPYGVEKGSPAQELERLLELAQIPEDQLDPFAVLGVEASASDTDLKRAYRQLAVQVHPDKNKHPRAGEAFKVLRAAWDVVSNPEMRREYELKRMAETELSRSMNEFLIKLQDDLKEAMNTMMCTKCEGKHKRFEMERDPSEARFCAECSRRHGAEEGDFWAESSMLGLRITYFAFMDGKVYDITEWAGCQRIGISPDTHRVPYHISFGSKNSSSATRHRTPSDPPPGPASPADLQDFFNRIFQGEPPNGMAANGGFFPSAAPPHHPAGPGPGPGGPFSAPPPHTGFFPPGGQRGDPTEPRTEAGKPPRRRKKVRKPFQRALKGYCDHSRTALIPASSTANTIAKPPVAFLRSSPSLDVLVD
ncbi:hypothetical protein AAFF_G00144950 [Aldrovandia affinis]|uniref:J domain-containing protein n=1 Tax=Aldrovandia affinis TaxID=143900 RepID=A0AAD7WX62_9TELE|nr:hypothetical protein AAFF_G00144950 [Aldrovandia affinis]